MKKYIRDVVNNEIYALDIERVSKVVKLEGMYRLNSEKKFVMADAEYYNVDTGNIFSLKNGKCYEYPTEDVYVRYEDDMKLVDMTQYEMTGIVFCGKKECRIFDYVNDYEEAQIHFLL